MKKLATDDAPEPRVVEPRPVHPARPLAERFLRLASADNSADNRRYVDLKTFCRMFGLGKNRVYRLRKAGVFTRLILEGRSRFIVAEGEAYMRSLDTGERPPPAPGRPRPTSKRSKRT